MRLLLPSINLSGVKLTDTTGAAPKKEDLVRLQVAALQALREFFGYRYAPEPLRQVFVSTRLSSITSQCLTS